MPSDSDIENEIINAMLKWLEGKDCSEATLEYFFHMTTYCAKNAAITHAERTDD